MQYFLGIMLVLFIVVGFAELHYSSDFPFGRRTILLKRVRVCLLVFFVASAVWLTWSGMVDGLWTAVFATDFSRRLFYVAICVFVIISGEKELGVFRASREFLVAFSFVWIVLALIVGGTVEWSAHPIVAFSIFAIFGISHVGSMWRLVADISRGDDDLADVSRAS